MLNEKKLYKEICNWYNYDFKIKESGKVMEFCGNTIEHKYNNIAEALKSWLSTLEETNNDSVVWTKKEIEYIESL